MASPLVPWIGGKRRLAKYIVPLLPAHTCYVEPFCGAAGIFFNKSLSQVEVLNDINGELVNLYRVVQHHLEEFCRMFKWALISRKIFEWEQMKVPATLTDIQRAARFYYLQKLSFGARVAGQNFGTSASGSPRLNLLRIEEELSAAHLRLAGVTIEHLDWQECIERYDSPATVFYLDPPYWETEGYGVEFGREQYDIMASLARSVRGKMLISVNDHPAMRQAFAGLPMETVAIKYTVGVGAPAERQELIIRNSADGWAGQGRLL